MITKRTISGRRQNPGRCWLLSMTLAVAFFSQTNLASAADGIWNNGVSGGLWSDPINWIDEVVADGSGSTADFSTINIGANNTVLFDDSRTLSSLIFGDTGSTYYNWTLSNNGNPDNVLTLDGVAPSIILVRGNLTNNVVIAGSSGLAVSNVASASYLVLNAANTFTGDLYVNAGTAGHLYLLVNDAGAMGGSPSSTNSVILAASSAARAQLFLSAPAASYPAHNQLVMRPLGSSGNSRAELHSKNAAIWNGDVILDGISGSSGVVCDFYCDSTAGPLTLNGNISTTNNYSGFFSLRGGTSAASKGIINGTVNIGSLVLGKNDPCVWTISSSGNSWGSMNVQGGSIVLGTDNVFPSTAPIAMSSGTTIDLNGHSQILSANVTGGTGRQITSSAPGSVLTVTNSTDLFCAVPIQGNISLVKSGSGTFALNAASSYTGDTLISEGVLTGSGGITSSTNIIIAAGAVLAPTGLSLGAGQNLKPVDQTSIVAGTVNMGNGTLVLDYTVGIPAMTVSNGNLVMSANSAAIINVTGTVTAGEMYKLVAATDGGQVSGTMPITVTLNGASGQAGSLVVSNGELYLIPSSVPFISTQSPGTNTVTLFAGASLSLSVAAGGVAPLEYQWFTNGVANTAATSSSMVWSDLPAGSLSAYCVVANNHGSVTSAVCSVSVIAPPTESYPVAVLADHPVGYWRLNEPDNGLGNYNAGVIAHDYMGGNNGIYTNISLGMPGYSQTSDPTTTSALFGYDTLDNGVAYGIEGVDFASPAGTSKTFSIEAWVNAYTPISDAGIVTKGYGSGGEQFDLDTGGTGHGFRFIVRNAAGVGTAASSSFVPEYGTWHHLVGVCDQPNGKILLYVDGKVVATGNISVNSGIIASTSPMSIGARYSSMSAMLANNYDSQYAGNINEVAVYNKALSADEVMTHYFASGVPPIITSQPVANTNVNENGTLTVSAVVNGTRPLSYMWFDINANEYIPGQTNATLVLNNVVSAGSYYLTVVNAYGSTNSDPVSVTVISGLNAGLTPNTDLSLYAGQTVRYTAVTSGTEPIYYQWYLNGASVPAATNSVYDVPVTLGSVSISCVVSNAYNGHSSVSLGPVNLVGVATPTDLYQVTILGNNPIAYWPLNEADNGLNDGNTGAVAHDYVGGHDGTYENVNLGLEGFNTDSYPDLMAGLFGVFTPIDSLVKEIDNSAYGIANVGFAKPAGANAAFSVEAWVNVTNSVQNASIVAKGCGHNEQFALDMYTGRFRFVFRGASAVANDSGVSAIAVNGQWYHVVGVWDGPNGAVRLYVNGNLATSKTGFAQGLGLLEPSVNPYLPGANLVTIGSRPESTSATSYDVNFQGKIANVAIYDYVLSTNQIADHYSIGIPVVTPGLLSITNSGGGESQLIWDFSGTLQGSTNVAGPFEDITGAVSPYTVTTTNTQMFYRVRQR